MKWISTPMAVSIHPEGESPVFSEGATQVSIDDEAAGPFVVIKQDGEVRLERGQLETVFAVAKELLYAHEALEKGLAQ